MDLLESKLSSGLLLTRSSQSSLFSHKTYTKTYTTCYNMCTQRTPYNWSERLYRKHGDTINSYLRREVLAKLKEKRDSFLLKELGVRWGNHMVMNKWLQKFFMYLDRYYVKHHTLATLSEAGLRHFKDLVYHEVKSDVAQAALVIIDNEREGKDVDRGLLREVVALYEAMGLGTLDSYTEDLEGPMLAATRTYYARKREDWISKDATPDYLVKAEKALQDEAKRVNDYLNTHSEPKVLNVCEEELLSNPQHKLLSKENSGMYALLGNDKTDDLKRMYALFSRVKGGLAPMADVLNKYIEDVGENHVKERKARIDSGGKEKPDDPTFVRALLKTHEKYADVIRENFGNHALFQKAMKDAYTKIINNNVGNFTNAELLSTFCDRLLKAGGEKMSESEIDNSLNKIVDLFTYLDDKDFFGEVFRNQLAKRLLNQKSASEDLEKSMLSKLKVQVGTQFTSKMEGMLNDLSTALEHEKSFKEFRATDSESNRDILDTSVQVLTMGNWPTYKQPEVALPRCMQPAVDQFMRFYASQENSRRLTWYYSLGTVKIKATYGGGKSYDLEVNTLQAAAIMAISECDGGKVTFKDLSEKLNLQADTLKPLMHSLTCGKYKVISKSSSSSKISTDDAFEVNVKFKNNNKRIKIPMASLDGNANKARVEEDRSATIDAAIVRIMKSRKTLGHQTLVSEVLSQLTFFKPNAKQIKKRIESLLEREYLERSEENVGCYNYLA